MLSGQKATAEDRITDRYYVNPVALRTTSDLDTGLTDCSVCGLLYSLGRVAVKMVAVTGDDDAQVIPPLGASRAAGRPRLWFRGYRGWGWLPAERVGELLIRESSSLVRSERDARGVRGAPR